MNALQHKYPPPTHSQPNHSDTSTIPKNNSDWHSSFCHPSENKLKALQKMYPQLDFIHPDHCDTCIMAKQRQLPYRSTNTRADKPLEIIHTDICVAKYRGYDGSQYF